MINALHLLWIVPLCLVMGYAVCAILRIGKEADERMDDIMRREREVNVFTTKDSDETGTVTITGTDQYGKLVTEKVTVPGVSDNFYVSIKGKDEQP